MSDALVFEGVVSSASRGDLYAVDLDGPPPRRVLAKRCGRMSHAHIRVILGDRVRVEVSPYDTSRGRITHRLDPSNP